MIIIHKYISNDGVEFSSEAACLKHERVTLAIQGALAPLGPAVKIDGESYISHRIEDVRAASNAVISIIQREYPTESIMDYTTDKCGPNCANVWLTWLGRYCDELTISKSLYRLICINQHTGRECNQIYHAARSTEV